MSWSFSAAGKPAAVVKSIRSQADSILGQKYIADAKEREQVDAAARIVAEVAEATTFGALHANCSGSMTGDGKGGTSYTFRVDIQPLHNFAE